MDQTQIRGSETAKNGFLNEHDIVLKFNNWKNDEDSVKWLTQLAVFKSELI